MQMIKRENGITMVVLVITIIVLTVIATITIQYSIEGTGYSQEKKLLSDLEAVYHAVYEQHEEYKTTGDESLLIGTSASKPSDVDIDWVDSGTYWYSSDNEKRYYELSPDNLEKIGVTGSSDTYIVNYYTGECYNQTKKNTQLHNEILYKK